MTTGENAILIEVAAAPSVDGYGDDTGSGDVLWRGRVACHLRRRRVLASNQGLATMIEQDEVIARPSAGAPLLQYAVGDRERADTILVEDRRYRPPTRKRYRVSGVTLRGGGGTIADSLLFVLRDGDT